MAPTLEELQNIPNTPEPTKGLGLVLPLSGVLPTSIMPSTGTPAGTGALWFSNTAPTDWAILDGSTITNAQTLYPDLWTNTAATWHSGSSIVLPDLRGRVPVGKGTNASIDTMGENDGVAVANRRPQHRHTGHAHYVNSLARAVFDATNDSWQVTSIGSSAGVNTSTVDGGSGNVNDSLDAPAHLVVNFIIKLT